MKMVKQEQLTQKQLAILHEIRANPRQHISQIAKKLGMPLSTAHDCCRAVNQCIRQCSAVVDFEQLGYGFRMNFIFRIRNSKIIRDFLLRHQNVNSISRVNNRNTLLVDCFFRNVNEAYGFKEMLEDRGIRNIEMRYIIEEIAREQLFTKA